MMKRILLSLLTAIASVTASAQVAGWLIPPAYDNLYKVIGADLIITESQQEKTLWTFDGQRLFTTNETLFVFQDDVALVTRGNTTAILGFVSTSGDYMQVNDFLVTNSYPYFSEGLLAVKSANDGYCHYIDKQGRVVISNCAAAYPFRNGFAKCEAFQDSQKKKGFNQLLLSKQGKPMRFTIKGKEIDDEDIAFISSVNDDKVAFVVVKQKVYTFDGKATELQPFCPDADSKDQAEVAGEATSFITKTDASHIELNAKCGRKTKVTVRMDALYVPCELVVNDDVKTYTQKKREPWLTETALEVTESTGRYALYWEGRELLPPQFDKVTTCFDNKAFVCLNGRYGLLRVQPDAQFTLSLNRGNDIAFRHQRAETEIRLDLPTGVDAKTATIEMDPASGCEIDVMSREAKVSSFGSSVQYGCFLTIPDYLDDDVVEVAYKARVSYDGLLSAPIAFTANEWYYRYFVIDVDDVETIIENDDLTFTFDISADKASGEELFPSNVNVRANDMPVRLEKLSETRYRCFADNIGEGTHQIVIQIQEPGCPLSEYPFEITYSKPAPVPKNVDKTTDKPADKPAPEKKVVIQNKAKPKKPAPPKPVTKPATKPKKPHLEI